MRCTDWRSWIGVAGSGGLLALVAACSSPSVTTTMSTTAPSANANAKAADAAQSNGTNEPSTRSASSSVAAARGAAETIELPPPGPVKNWDELRRQAARRIVAANPHGTYMGTVPDALLAIPVLEIELRRDGNISHIVILRPPREAKDTSELAIAAVRRAAPFGDVSKLPRPWKFTETFLFDDERKFKPRTLDE